MISDALQKWPIVIYVTLALAKPQFPMPGYPPMFPMLPAPPPMSPMNMPMSIGIAIIPDIEISTTTKAATTTTRTIVTTTKRPDFDVNEYAIAVPMPMPMPMPMPAPMQLPMSAPMPMPPPMPSPVVFAVPGMETSCQLNPGHPNCPLCPPCSCFPCTPAFFSYCSSCHLKCRCRNGQDAPIPLPPSAPRPLSGPAFPMPYPMKNQADVAFVPFKKKVKSFHRHKNVKSLRHRQKTKHDHHPKHVRPYVLRQTDTSSHHRKEHHHLNHVNLHNYVISASQDDLYGDSESPEQSKIKSSQSYGSFDLDRSDDLFIKPVLTYISDDGEIKIHKPLDKAEASKLMNDEDNNNIDKNRRTNLVINDLKRLKDLNHEFTNIGHGQKRLIFRPPSNMLLRNLSVTFTT